MSNLPDCDMCYGYGMVHDGKSCPRCGGTGVDDPVINVDELGEPTYNQMCQTCSGKGMTGPFKDPTPCDDCRGTGLSRPEECPWCGGSGTMLNAFFDPDSCENCEGTGMVNLDIDPF